LTQEVGARLGRLKKWPGGAVVMSIYIPVDLRNEIERRARARRMSLSEYAVRLLLSGLEAEKETEANRGAEAQEVP
jgi:hypothetical protein